MNRPSGMETSISMANSPPRRAIRLVSTLPPRSSSTPVTRSTMPIRSGPVRVRTKFLDMEKLPFDVDSGRYLIAGGSRDATRGPCDRCEAQGLPSISHAREVDEEICELLSARGGQRPHRHRILMKRLDETAPR